MKPAFLALLLLALVAAAACGDQRTSSPEEEAVQAASLEPAYGDDPIENGRLSYVQYCASCHGTQGRGEGPVAPALTTPPTDLTQLAAANGGVYPAEEVAAYIDGRARVEAHGTREMPVWGNVWSERDGEPVRQELVSQRIDELAEYLRTIQRAP
jgi:cytochrome c553